MEKELKFKTTINCGGCVAKITPLLNGIPRIEWNVDTSNPDKTLLVKGTNISEDEIINVVKKAGFKVERMQ